MRILAYSLCALVGSTLLTRQAAADCLDPLADPDSVLELHLRVTAAQWEALVFDQLEPDNAPACDQQYPYHEVEFRCGDDETWITIGARHKRGDQRGLDTEEKPPLKLDFNRYVTGQRWPEALGNLGFRKLSLNNGQEDNPGGVLTALLTEHLAWRVMREEVPSGSRSVYAQLWIHFEEDNAVEYHGLYIVLEDIDRSALKRRYGNAQGTLLKTTSPSCHDQLVFADEPSNAATEAFEGWWEQDPNASYPQGWWGEADKGLYVDELLRQEAIRDVLANGPDTVLGNNWSNFLSWDSKTDKRHYLPWDLDDVFRPMPQDVPYDTPLTNSCGPLGSRTRCHPELGQAYLETACQLINGTLSVERLLEDFDHVDALIRPLIPAETDLVWGGTDPLNGEADNTYQHEYARIREWIENRIPYVRGQIEAAGVPCALGCPEGATEACDYLSCAGIRSCVDGLWTTCEVEAEAGEAACNGLDDNCNLQIDENCVEVGSSGGETTSGAGSDGGTGQDSAAPTTGTAGGSSGDSSVDSGSDGDGCGCTQSDPSAWWLALLPWVWGARRRALS